MKRQSDIYSKEKRSQIMSLVKSKNTKPEKRVRSELHKLGYRFSLHRKALPGYPDIVLPKYKSVVFVHGCFWHRHRGCKFAYTPKSRLEFWVRKFDSNVARDRLVARTLRQAGWRVIRIWECDLTTTRRGRVINRLRREFERTAPSKRA